MERVDEPPPHLAIPAGTAERVAEIGPRCRPQLECRPERRPARAFEGRDWRALAIVAGASLVLGFAHGAISVVRVDVAAGPPASRPEAIRSGTIDSDPIRGPLWRPVGSLAERPAVTLRPVLWRPAGSNVRLRGPVADRALERGARRD